MTSPKTSEVVTPSEASPPFKSRLFKALRIDREPGSFVPRTFYVILRSDMAQESILDCIPDSTLQAIERIYDHTGNIEAAADLVSGFLTLRIPSGSWGGYTHGAENNPNEFGHGDTTSETALKSFVKVLRAAIPEVHTLLTGQSSGIAAYRSRMRDMPVNEVVFILRCLELLDEYFLACLMNPDIPLTGGPVPYNIDGNLDHVDSRILDSTMLCIMSVFHVHFEVSERLKNQLSAVAVVKTTGRGEDIDNAAKGFLSSMLSTISPSEPMVQVSNRFYGSSDGKPTALSDDEIFASPFGETFSVGVDTSSIPVSTNYVRSLFSGAISTPGSRFPALQVLEMIPACATWEYGAIAGSNANRQTLHKADLGIRTLVDNELHIDRDYSVFGISTLTFRDKVSSRYLRNISRLMSDQGWRVHIRKIDIVNGAILAPYKIKFSDTLKVRGVSDRGDATISIMNSAIRKFATDLCGKKEEYENAISSYSSPLCTDEGITFYRSGEEKALVMKAREIESNYRDGISLVLSHYLNVDLAWEGEIKEGDDVLRLYQITAYPPVSELQISDVLFVHSGGDVGDISGITDTPLYYPGSSRSSRVGSFCRAIHHEVRQDVAGKDSVLSDIVASTYGIMLGKNIGTPPDNDMANSDFITNANSYSWRKLCQLFQKYPIQMSKMLVTLQQLSPSRIILTNCLAK